jgi:hypothetical protein
MNKIAEHIPSYHDANNYEFIFDENGTPYFRDDPHKDSKTHDPCFFFDDQEIEKSFYVEIKQSDAANYAWGSCQEASVAAATILHDIVSPYTPEYTLVWATRLEHGHSWLETSVCGYTYITDLVGHTAIGPELGFGQHYFSNTLLMQDTDDNRGYFHVNSRITLETQDPDNIDKTTYHEKQVQAKEALPKSILESLLSTPKKWIKKLCGK